MVRPVIPASRVPSPRPWLVRGEAEAVGPPETVTLGVEFAKDDRSGGFPFLFWEDWALAPGGLFQHATCIQRHRPHGMRGLHGIRPV